MWFILQHYSNESIALITNYLFFRLCKKADCHVLCSSASLSLCEIISIPSSTLLIDSFYVKQNEFNVKHQHFNANVLTTIHIPIHIIFQHLANIDCIYWFHIQFSFQIYFIYVLLKRTRKENINCVQLNTNLNVINSKEEYVYVSSFQDLFIIKKCFPCNLSWT